MKFLLDTSFLMIPGKHGVDIFEKLNEFGQPELYTLDMVVDELKTHIEEGKGETKRSAKLALSFIERLGIKIVEVKKKKGTKTDDELFKKGSRFVICTQDIELGKRLRAEGAKVVYLRQQKYLCMD
ncbi:MAG: nucleotide-binding protein [Candidatus Aenigmarchaeota archaeon]|nr:nucleotide-binding protein [Candidatus Aenigmarchaeota archaeon]